MELTWKSLGDGLVAIVSAIFTGVVGVLKSSWEASHKWFAVGCVIFGLLVWFGYAHLPTFSSKDTALEKQVAELSQKLDRMSANIDALKIPAVAPNSKKKLTK
jgi:hypothetical protein